MPASGNTKATAAARLPLATGAPINQAVGQAMRFQITPMAIAR